MERGGSNSIFRFYYVFASSQYLDATRLKSCNRLCFLSLEILGEGEDNEGEQLFYKLANLDDRVKNADQVSGSLTPKPQVVQPCTFQLTEGRCST